MKACVDVHYEDETARAALVLFSEWSDASSSREFCIETRAPDPYQPGEFYRRELGPILAVLSVAAAEAAPVTTLLIDGYCQLSPGGEPGLGARVYEAAPSLESIVGVAKTRFQRASHALEVFRGGSKRPLYVTVLGNIDLAEAGARIEAMHGGHRIPALLKRADRLARDGV